MFDPPLSKTTLTLMADLGDVGALLPATLAAAAVLGTRGTWRDAANWAGPIGLCVAATVAAKLWVRPFAIMIGSHRFTTQSFPSGHAALATVFYGGLAALLWRARLTGWRGLLAKACAIAAVLPAAAVIWAVHKLGWHHSLDLSAGILLGGACTALAAKLPRSPFLAPSSRLGAAAIAALAIIALHGLRIDDMAAFRF